MANLNHPQIVAGLLNAADLDTARRESTGRIHLVCTAADYHEGTIPVGYGYEQAAEACTEVGADSAMSMRRHYSARRCVALAVLLAVTGAAGRMAWPLLGG